MQPRNVKFVWKKIPILATLVMAWYIYIYIYIYIYTFSNAIYLNRTELYFGIFITIWGKGKTELLSQINTSWKGFFPSWIIDPLHLSVISGLTFVGISFDFYFIFLFFCLLRLIRSLYVRFMGLKGYMISGMGQGSVRMGKNFRIA